MRRLLPVLLVLAAVGACAHVARSAKPGAGMAPECMPVYGACVLFEGSMRASMPQVREAFEHAAALWKTDPWALRGWTVVFHGMAPLGWGDIWFWGLTQPPLRRIDVVFEMPQCPALVLVHEWGHVALRTGGHEDARYATEVILANLSDVPGCAP